MKSTSQTLREWMDAVTPKLTEDKQSLSSTIENLGKFRYRLFLYPDEGFPDYVTDVSAGFGLTREPHFCGHDGNISWTTFANKLGQIVAVRDSSTGLQQIILVCKNEADAQTQLKSYSGLVRTGLELFKSEDVRNTVITFRNSLNIGDRVHVKVKYAMLVGIVADITDDRSEFIVRLKTGQTVTYDVNKIFPINYEINITNTA